MSRQRLVLPLVLALGVSAASLAACGGSSSETPPPLEPDPRGFHYAPAQASISEETDAGDAPRTVGNADNDEPTPRAKSNSTRGGGKPPAR
jgi:hypothetical protein